MRLSFSTRGCPKWTWQEIIYMAKELGYDGIELRSIGDERFMPTHSLFAPERIGGVKEKLKKTGLTIPCIATDVHLHNRGRDEMSALRQYIVLAASLKVENIRVLGDAAGALGDPVDIDLVRGRLAKAIPLAAATGVTLLVETNGVFANSEVLKALIEELDSPSVQVLWDMHHPCRFMGESPETTYRNIGKYVRHTHVKDSVMQDGKAVVKMIGHGDLPMLDFFRQLKYSGYTGYISLEWERRWQEEFEDPGVIFSHFVRRAAEFWEKA